MPRKGENIYKRKDGRWEGRYISSYGVDGKAKYSYVYAKSYSEVKEKLLHAKSHISATSYVLKKVDRIKCSDWLTEWLEKKRFVVKESTFIRYRNMIENHIRPALGEYPISKVSTDLMERIVHTWLSSGRLDCKGGLSVKSVTDLLLIIKEVFKYAQYSGVKIICNFDQITIKKTSHEMRVLSINEEKQLISVLVKEMDRYKLGVYICLFTGIRIGELCALKWGNISFSDKTLRIERTMQRLQKQEVQSVIKTQIIVTEPKSFAAIRTIPLPDFLIDTIRPFAGNANSFVLSGDCREYVEPRTMQNKFKKYLEEGQITPANFHSLRHTFATRCVEMGFDIKSLSEILGHSSVKITLDKYVHSSMEQKRTNMEKLYDMAI